MTFKWQAFFFDFDGVVLDSVNIKTEAFAQMFRPYGPDVERAVVQYHLDNGGVSRFRKFEYYYRQLLHEDISPDRLDELGAEFSRIALNNVLKAPFIDGAIETLSEIRRQGLPAFVVSGTPEDEVRHIVRERNLEDYFIEVHGSPRKKHEIVQDIAVRFGFDLKRCLFVGDALTDYEASRICGTDFLGVVKNGDPVPFPGSVAVSSGVHLD
ncbi:HAD hydrolase-like protein [Desulfatiferula olefinivorans]